ncbi:MAG: DUF3516 domain-containing protein, partial [Thermoanaerobaculia bacterium]|nr:DUF3516 domain-containing protein [Thermoanaerobaculia bacterium]
ALRDDQLLRDPRAFAARVRAELHQVVRALAAGDWKEAAASIRPDRLTWSAQDLEAAMAPFLAEHEKVDFGPRARQAHMTRIAKTGPRVWEVSQVLPDPAGEDLWCLEGRIDLSRGKSLESPLFILDRLGT